MVARFPELGALLGLRRPLEIEPAVVARDLLHRLRLLDHARFGAVEFEQQRRRLAVAHLVVAIEAAIVVAQSSSLRAIGTPICSVWITVFAAPFDRREGAQRRGHRRLHRMQLDRHLGDDAERAFRAYEEARQVVAGRRFLRASRGLDDPAIARARP
jgi:hypothetical protein